MQSLFLAPAMCILSLCAAITLALGIKSTMNKVHDIYPGTLSFLLVGKNARSYVLIPCALHPKKIILHHVTLPSSLT